MNRILKFRAWNGKSWIWMSISGDQITRVNFPEKSEGEVVWMQFTGLLDKNGKEIYEGDILQNHDEVFEVQYDSQMFCLKDFTFPIWKANTKDCWEVIGNIFTSPELLNE